MYHGFGSRKVCGRHRKHTQEDESSLYTSCLQKVWFIVTGVLPIETSSVAGDLILISPSREHVHTVGSAFVLDFLVHSRDFFPYSSTFKEKCLICQWVVSQMADRTARLQATAQEVINTFQSSSRKVLAWL